MATGGIFTQEFAHEFEAERGRWLRRRFLWYAGVVISFSVLVTVLGAGLLMWLGGEQLPAIIVRNNVISMGFGFLGTVLYIIAFFRVRRTPMSRDHLLGLVARLIIASGLIGFASQIMQAELTRPLARQAYAEAAARRIERENAPPDASTDASPASPDVSPDLPVVESGVVSGEGEPLRVRTVHVAGMFSPTHGVRAGFFGFSGAGQIFFTHFFACLFLPWSPRESLKPVIPLFIACAAITIIYGVGEWASVILTIALAPLVASPGVLICWFRISRFRDKFSHRMLRSRYTEVRKELIDARRIHESLFPKSIDDGPVRFDYHYEPMRQIGGDFLYARTTNIPGGTLPALDVSIIDVTGHGISAALTVNRLFGELERQYAEHPAIEPGTLLTGLNAYIHNTLATHSVYATALCVRINLNDDTLTWASAGHPPAFVRTVDGRLHQLHSTTLVLGACHGGDFGAHPEKMHFGRGDVLIAYTDGAIEARSATGAMLRVEGLMGMIHSCRATEAGSIGRALVDALTAFRYGGALDDTLFVEVFRPLEPSSSATPTPASSAAR